ncbi:MAG TPA: BTAD domain-containing putative transcriptional regulator [Casimicrobiaceae bacterium]|nr:BTAD domain-containing putative transcriptional regulator [Casimicrobiaceae bacterium]
MFRDPESENLAPCARRLEALLDGEDDVNVRVMAASTLFNYINWKTEGEAAPALVARIEPILERPEVTPLMQVWWRTHLSFWHYINGRYGESTKIMAEARAVAERYGLEAYLFEIDHADASALINKGAHVAAQALLEAMERRLSPTQPMQWPYFHHLRSMLEQRLGNAGAAVDQAELAVSLARETGLPSLQMPHFLTRLAQARAAAGDREGALKVIDEAIAVASPSERTTFEQRREVLLIEAELDAGEAQSAATRLAKVLAEQRSRGQLLLLKNRPDLAARLAAFALERGIEPEFVRSLIEHNALAAPPGAGAVWPFRLRIRALGGFQLIRDGAPMVFTGKAQQRPLDLLKLVVALGGRDVDAQQLMSALWPEADGAAAKTSFDTTLFRLRKLLAIDGALALTAGKVSLAPTLVWTDVWALERALEKAERNGASAGPDGAAVGVAKRLVAYPGPLLGTEESRWVVQPRDALRSRFVRTLTSLGEELERQAERAIAVEVYRRGLEADNLAEALYRGLMRALAATGHHADALNAFRRCRELLSIVLGVKPSTETERLHREIVAGHKPA